MPQKHLVQNVLALSKAERETQIKEKLAKQMDEGNTGSTKEIVLKAMQPYINNSVGAFTYLIKNQAASKLALKELKYTFDNFGWAKKVFQRTSIKEAQAKIMSWSYDVNFLSIRHELEKFLVEHGKAFLGFGIRAGKPYPFMAKVTELKMDPITRQIINLTYLINEVQVNGKIYNLEERWTLNIETDKYDVKRQFGRNETKKGQLPNIETREYYRSDTGLDSIQGELIFNNDDFVSEIQFAKQYMEQHGEFSFWLTKKFRTMSSKVLSKEGISGKDEATMEEDFEWKSMISFGSRAAQYQQPVTPFTPTLPNQSIQETIDFLEEKIFITSLASRPTDTGKQAQTGNLEMTLKNEAANNYTEYKKHLRSVQLTKFIRKIAGILKIEKSTDLFVEVQVSATQERLLNPDIDGKAAQQTKTDVKAGA